MQSRARFERRLIAAGVEKVKYRIEKDISAVRHGSRSIAEISATWDLPLTYEQRAPILGMTGAFSILPIRLKSRFYF